MTNETLQSVTQAFQKRFGAVLREFQDEVTLILPAEQISAAALAARDEFGFDLLIDVTAVDYWPHEKPRFHIVYHLYGMKHNQVVCLRAPLDDVNPNIATVEGVWPAANWFEREVWDMFGITFIGHSDPRRIVMPEDWVGHPLRKDYPLGYEEVQFTFNAAEISKRKPKPSN